MTNGEAEFWSYCLILVLTLVSAFVIVGIFFLIGLVIYAFVPSPHRPKYGVYDVRDYKTPEWQLLRGHVLQRENGRCQYCGGTAQNAHHLSYHQGIICNPRFLQAVCWPCHHGIHDGSIQQIDTSNRELVEWELTDFEIEQLVARGEEQLDDGKGNEEKT